MLNVLRKGEDFAALAGQYSQDQTANDGGEMGWFREIDAYSGIGAEFAEACFTASKNQLVSVRSKYGWHVVQVQDKTKAVEKSKVAQLYFSVTPSSKTYSAEYNKLNKLLAENTKAADFLEAAREAGYQVSNAAVVKSSDNTIGNVPDMRQAVRYVYNNKLGAVSTVLENSNNQFMVVAVTGVHDNEYLNPDQVRDELSREIINEKKAAAIIASLQTDENADLSKLAQVNNMQTDTVRLVNFSMRRITGLGEEPALLAAVMNAAKGELSKPVAGKNAVYVFRVLSQVEPEIEFDVDAEKRNLDMNNNYRLTYQAYEALRAAKEVEDNRIRFY
ncbi:MAG: peptidylprolyl isomerase [Bacteroidales bacterium]|nr:peptidylprolyl isomerase [Bacteroidales bacterium]